MRPPPLEVSWHRPVMIYKVVRATLVLCALSQPAAAFQAGLCGRPAIAQRASAVLLTEATTVVSTVPGEDCGCEEGGVLMNDVRSVILYVVQNLPLIKTHISPKSQYEEAQTKKAVTSYKKGCAGVIPNLRPTEVCTDGEDGLHRWGSRGLGNLPRDIHRGVPKLGSLGRPLRTRR